jgi:hypothetical protein
MQRTLTIRRLAAAGLAAVLAGGLSLGTAAAAPADRPGTLTPAQRQVIREATRRYHDPAAAVAAGYLPTDECVEDPALGGMGYHYAHPRLLADQVIDSTLPEVLVYAPDRHGGRRLVAIEYVKDDADGDLGTDGDRPSLFGEPFDGPMEGHQPGQPVHYDLHAWVWKHNPAGELAQFNPEVSCPPAG